MASIYDVFVSYSRHDQAFVRMLVQRLEQSGVSVFYDEANIAIGQPLADSLHRAVENATYVLVVMSPDYFESQWGTQELHLALQQEFASDRTKVIPLLVRDCEIPPLLKSKVYADFRATEAFEQTFSKLLAAIFTRPVSSVRQLKEESKPPALGSIDPSTAGSVELREIVNDLRAKVEAFMEGSVSQNKLEKIPAAEVDPKLCFIVMPFGPEELTDVYEYFVKPSIETNCGLKCERGDDVFGSNVIMDDIRRSIERSRLVVADLTGRNPNVFYEVGIAHTLNKEVLLISQSMSDVPFDLRHRRVLVYDYTPKGCKKLERTIADNINAILLEKA